MRNYLESPWADVVAVLLGVAIGFGLLVSYAYPRDLDGRYAASPLKKWFNGLTSGKGPCCSDADGTALSDVDWEARDGRYRVRIENRWWDVPDEAVLREPNLYGQTMVWPIYYRDHEVLRNIEVRCFIVGAQG